MRSYHCKNEFDRRNCIDCGSTFQPSKDEDIKCRSCRDEKEIFPARVCINKKCAVEFIPMHKHHVRCPKCMEEVRAYRAQWKESQLDKDGEYEVGTPDAYEHYMKDYLGFNNKELRDSSKERSAERRREKLDDDEKAYHGGRRYTKAELASAQSIIAKNQNMKAA